MNFFSQDGQDKFLVDIFNRKREGIFLDIGAFDGIDFSNTFYLEKELGWKGICVEPNPIVFKQLVENRDCICINACISNEIGLKKFLAVTGYGIMLSGLTDFIDQEHLRRIDDGIAKYGGEKTIIEVDSLPITNILENQSITLIDYCNIDVEGGEMSVLKSIDFLKVTIKVFTIENNNNGKEVNNLLKSFGYRLITKLGADEVYELNSRRYGLMLNFRIRKLKHKISYYKRLIINKFQ